MSLPTNDDFPRWLAIAFVFVVLVVTLGAVVYGTAIYSKLTIRTDSDQIIQGQMTDNTVPWYIKYIQVDNALEAYAGSIGGNFRWDTVTTGNVTHDAMKLESIDSDSSGLSVDDRISLRTTITGSDVFMIEPGTIINGSTDTNTPDITFADNAPASGDCDNASEVGSLRLRTDSQTDGIYGYVCTDDGTGSAYEWQELSAGQTGRFADSDRPPVIYTNTALIGLSRFCGRPTYVGGSNINRIANADQWKTVPVYVPKAITVDNLQVEITTACTGSVCADTDGYCCARMAIYDSSTSTGLPNSLLVQTANFDTSTTACTVPCLSTQSITATTLRRGWYWLSLWTELNFYTTAFHKDYCQPSWFDDSFNNNGMGENEKGWLIGGSAEFDQASGFPSTHWSVNEGNFQTVTFNHPHVIMAVVQ